MPKYLTQLIVNHRSLSIFYRFPGLIRLQHVIVWLITLRFWYVFRTLKRILRKRGNSSYIIDVGCASGEILFPLSRRFPDCEFVGIDISDSALEACTRLAEHKDLKQVTFVKSDLFGYKPETRADLVFCISVIQLIPDLEKVLKKLLSFLNPGGNLIIYVPVNFKRVIPGYHKLRTGWLKESDYGFYYPEDKNMNEADLRRKLEKAGASEIRAINCYGTPGKIAYELITLGQLMILHLNWLLAIPFGLVYFPVIIIPALLLMIIDMLYSHQSGNGLIMIAKKPEAEQSSINE